MPTDDEADPTHAALSRAIDHLQQAQATCGRESANPTTCKLVNEAVKLAERARARTGPVGPPPLSSPGPTPAGFSLTSDSDDVEALLSDD